MRMKRVRDRIKFNNCIYLQDTFSFLFLSFLAFSLTFFLSLFTHPLTPQEKEVIVVFRQQIRDRNVVTITFQFRPKLMN